MKLDISLPNQTVFKRFDTSTTGDSEILIAEFNGEIKRFQATRAEIDVAINSIAKQSFRFDFDATVPQNHYESLVAKAVRHIHNAELQKVVLSRRVDFKYNGVFPVNAFLIALRNAYPAAYVYALHLEESTWIGASPETFVSSDEDEVLSFSLAGTRKLLNGAPVTPFTHKEREEQQVVTQFIADTFSSCAIHQVKVTPPKIHHAGNLAHLLSTISGKLANDDKSLQTNQLMTLLHPTPAVCGWPKQPSRKFINENELTNRELYAGILGFKLNSTLHSWVNLRCMKVHRQGFSCYVGGGITADSVPHDEWMETEHKLQTLLNVLAQFNTI